MVKNYKDMVKFILNPNYLEQMKKRLILTGLVLSITHL